MDQVFFSAKRAHHAGLKFMRPRLAEFGLTPARFDLLYLLEDRTDIDTQSALRAALGVARATICEMLGALEKLGWLVRSPSDRDRRTRFVRLTARGRDVLERAYARWIGRGDATVAVDACVAGGNLTANEFAERSEFDMACLRLRRFFGDGAIAELYGWWDPQEYLGAFVWDGVPSDEIPFVE